MALILSWYKMVTLCDLVIDIPAIEHNEKSSSSESEHLKSAWDKRIICLDSKANARGGRVRFLREMSKTVMAGKLSRKLRKAFNIYLWPERKLQKNCNVSNPDIVEIFNARNQREASSNLEKTNCKLLVPFQETTILRRSGNSLERRARLACTQSLDHQGPKHA
uniref:Uncharacterized protein n=1 Tax=Glossina pallidipes TaxID=7398 RepID=A0A1A9ZV16_GLOPL